MRPEFTGPGSFESGDKTRAGEQLRRASSTVPLQNPSGQSSCLGAFRPTHHRKTVAGRSEGSGHGIIMSIFKILPFGSATYKNEQARIHSS